MFVKHHCIKDNILFLKYLKLSTNPFVLILQLLRFHLHFYYCMILLHLHYTQRLIHHVQLVNLPALIIFD